MLSVIGARKRSIDQSTRRAGSITVRSPLRDERRAQPHAYRCRHTARISFPAASASRSSSTWLVDAHFNESIRIPLRSAGPGGRMSDRSPKIIETAYPQLNRSTPRDIVRDMGEGHRARPAQILLTVDETADLLRTTRRAIYAMIERRQLPGVIRIRRRVLLRTSELLDWLDQKRAPSPEE